MEVLSYKTLEKMGNREYVLKEAPEKVLQFGEGNFLRGFVDDFIDTLNEKQGFNGKVAVVQPIETGMADAINRQEGLYQLYLRGTGQDENAGGRRLISCISRAINPYTGFEDFLAAAHNPELRVIVSNTTEAGIVYDSACGFGDQPGKSFPAKLTRFLYERYTAFAKAEGFIILPCELIDDPGTALLTRVQKHAADWALGEDFSDWLATENVFCNTLVDRIVTGYPRIEAEELNEANGFSDQLLDTAEPFGLWIIEGPQWIEEKLPFRQAGLPVVVVQDYRLYKQRKVRILNGAHTGMALAAVLSGERNVKGCMENPVIRRFVEKMIFDEIIPTLSLPREELVSFAGSVLERFRNPFIDHRLLDISLNSVSKWKARVMPSLETYFEQKGKLPMGIVLSFAALIAFYRKGLGNDTDGVMAFFEKHAGCEIRRLVEDFSGPSGFFEKDLCRYPGFVDSVTNFVTAIEEKGMKRVLYERDQDQ